MRSTRTRKHTHFDSHEVLARARMVDAMAAIESAFMALRDGRVRPPVSLGVDVEEGTFHVKACAGAAPEGRPLFVAKVNANFPGNPARGLPTIQGVVAVFDAADGTLLATMDSASITSLRTAATTAVAIRHLAREGARIATVVGCGALGRMHVEALAALGIGSIHACDVDGARAEALAAWAGPAFGIDCRAGADWQAAAFASQIVVTCTTSRVPFVGAHDVRPGTFVAAVGADNDRKSEIDSTLLARARIVTDQTEQCRKSGDLRNAAPGDAYVCAELSEVVGGRVPRTGADEVVLFDSTGLAVEDLAVCALVLNPPGRAKGAAPRPGVPGTSR